MWGMEKVNKERENLCGPGDYLQMGGNSLTTSSLGTIHLGFFFFGRYFLFPSPSSSIYPSSLPYLYRVSPLGMFLPVPLLNWLLCPIFFLICVQPASISKLSPCFTPHAHLTWSHLFFTSPCLTSSSHLFNLVFLPRYSRIAT